MSYSFSYKTESSLHNFYGENINEYPKNLDLITPESFVSNKETIEDAFIEFLEQDFGVLWDVDPEVFREDGTYKNINQLPGYVW